METDNDGGGGGQNPRQPPKREGDPEPQEGQPTPKKASTEDTSTSGTALEVEPESSASSQSESQPNNPPTEENVGPSMQRIFAGVEKALGQSMADLGHLLVRNEPALTNYVESIRARLRLHQGHMEPCLEAFLEALGPSPPNSTPARPSATQVEGDPEAPSQMTVKSARDFLRYLGRALDRLSLFGGDIEYDGMLPQTLQPEGVVDRNYVVRQFAGVLFHLAEILQYTYRSKIETIAREVESQVPGWCARMDMAIKTLHQHQSFVVVEPRSTVIQPQPRLMYPALPEPGRRYQIVVPTPELDSSTPKESQSRDSLHHSENMLALRYGHEEFVSGQRTTRVHYVVDGIEFDIVESFSSNGWIDSSGTDGLSIRWLSFNTTQFEDGSVVYRIEDRKTLANDASKSPGTQSVIVVSGIPKNRAGTAASNSNPRTQFSFLLPSHLIRTNINDAGLRDGVIKIQFVK